VAKHPSIDERQLKAQHLAWGVLLLAFAVFCVLCVASGIGIHYFLFKSTIPMQTELTVGRGTAIVTHPDLNEQPVQSRLPLNNRVMVSIDSVGQAILSFYDTQDDAQQLVASVILSSNTTVDLEELSRPRFAWSTAGYEVHIDKFSGRIDVTIPDGLERPVQMLLESASGGRIRLTENGRYSITANNAQILVETISGRAELVVEMFDQNVGSGERVMYNLATSEISSLNPYIRLLGTDAFDEIGVFASNAEPTTATWECFNRANLIDNIPGSFGVVVEDGRPVLHFTRTGSSQNGESVCHTSQGGTAIDVSGYQYLSVEVVFKINSQSLSGCGQLGSECPLMLRLEYVPAVPSVEEPARLWNHGFYLWNSQPTYPLICDTCTQQHENVNGGIWYRYRSDNLFGVFIGDNRPVEIVALRVYASGHEYDVYVSEVSLLASANIDPAPVGGSITPRLKAES
jgi:hypothetical protein